MKILCTKDNLLTGVQVVQRAVSAKSTLPILSGIFLKTTNDRLFFNATDLDLGITYSVPIQTYEEGSIVVPARIFTEIVRRLPDSTIEINTEGNSNITINYHPSKITVNCMDPEEFPIIPEIDENISVTILSSVFKNIVKQVSFSTSNDENRPIFTGILLIIEHDTIKMIATDTHRMAYRSGNLENSIDDIFQSIIPAKALIEVSRLIQEDDEVLKIVLNEKQVLFKFGELTLISRLIDGQFPNYKQVIPTSCKTKIRVNTKQLLASAERAALLAKDGSNIIKLKVEENNLVLKSNSAELGNVHEEIPIDIQGEQTQIAFNSRYLIDVLKVIDSEEIILELTGSLSPGVVRPIEVNNYLYLILPVRTN